MYPVICSYKKELFRANSFLEQVATKGINIIRRDKYNHVFVCLSLKYTLSSGQKPVYTVKILISEQLAFAAVVYFGQVFVFCRLINKSVLEWFLPIMCK